MGILLKGTILLVLISAIAARNDTKSIQKRSAGPPVVIGGVAIIGAAILFNWITKNRNPCVIYTKTDLALNEPVFYKNGLMLAPKDGYYRFNYEESVNIACPGSSIDTGKINIDSATIECVHDKLFYMFGEFKHISSIQCRQKVTGNSLSSINVECPVTYVQIGFQTSLYQFLPLFYSCFNQNSNNVIYTKHTLLGNELPHRSVAEAISFKKDVFYGNIPVNSAYTIAQQDIRFAQLLGPNQSTTGSHYLERGHLTPKADQILKTWQWSTFFYINAVPMWKAVNNGNWKILEETIRSYASRNHRNLEIFTGSHDTLTLPIGANRRVSITLDPGDISVPRYLWKVVKADNGGIAFVVSNNPFKQDLRLCGSQQQDYGWNQAGFATGYSRGAVFICTVAELKQVVPTVPNAANVGFTLWY